MNLLIDLPALINTEALAVRFSQVLTAPLVLGFTGEIGAGKTAFIRAMLRALGVEGAIKSPTFALVESYNIILEKEPGNQHISDSRYDSTAFSRIKDLQIHHFDLYRIQDESELEYIGFRDYFTSPSICCIEWSERLEKGFEFIDIHLTLSMKETGRRLQLDAISPKGCDVLSSLSTILE
jgi:tRNA threonylcarbamoyladenosine biosynthesis protein TsaE